MDILKQHPVPPQPSPFATLQKARLGAQGGDMSDLGSAIVAVGAVGVLGAYVLYKSLTGAK